jgi:hypothetical protein
MTLQLWPSPRWAVVQERRRQIGRVRLGWRRQGRLSRRAASVAAADAGAWQGPGRQGRRVAIWFTCAAAKEQSTRRHCQKEEDSGRANGGWRRAGGSRCNRRQEGEEPTLMLSQASRSAVYKTAWSPSSPWPSNCMKRSAAHGSKALALD